MLKDNSPLVSIIIPVYNGSNFLKRAIDSAIHQSYKNIEVLVINDGSIDNGATRDIALSYGNKIKYYEKNNGGVSSALNFGISKMSGDYFSWLSHDDEYSNEKIKNQIDLLSMFNYDKNLIAYCGTKYMDVNNKFYKNPQKEVYEVSVLYNGIDALYLFLSGGKISGCSLLIPCDAFKKAGYFDITLRYSQDAFMWCKMFFCGYNFIFKDTYDVFSRIHSGQLTNHGEKIYKHDVLYIYEKICPLIKRQKKAKELFYAYARHNAFLGNSELIKKMLNDNEVSKMFNFNEKSIIKISSLLGKFRPFVRKIYYIFKNFSKEN